MECFFHLIGGGGFNALQKSEEGGGFDAAAGGTGRGADKHQHDDREDAGF